MPASLRVVLLALLFVCPLAALSAVIPLPGPKLDAVPGPTVTLVNVPAAATWPLLRYERPPRLLVIAGKNESIAAYQRIARRLRATLDVRYIGGGDDIYHVNDKWIEPRDNPSYDELTKMTRQLAGDAIKFAGERSPYDVIFSNWNLDDAAMQADLIKYMQAGGVLVVCGSAYPKADTALGQLWPAKPTNNTWMQSGSKHTAAPEIAGVPTEYLAGGTWIPIPIVTEGATALATGESGAMFKRSVGKGTLLYVPTGPISKRHNTMSTISRLYDHDEIWLRVWDQALYTILRGETAIPAYADIQPGDKEALPGQDYMLPARVVNRKFAGPLAVTVHVTNPRGKIVFAKEEKLTLAQGEEKAYDLKIAIPPDWGAGIYPVYLTVADPATKHQLQQAMAFIPVTGMLELSLKSEKRGYTRGEEAKLTLTAAAKAPWGGKIAFGIYDFRGRLLAVSEKFVQFTPEKQDITFTYRLADHGMRDYTYWAQAAAISDGKEFGRAETKFYSYDRWSMRNEYQWSTWAGIACAPPSNTPAGMRLMAFAGMNSLGYPGRSELHYAAERWGWRYYNEGVGMNTFSPVIEYENETEIEQQLLKEAKGASGSPDMTTAAFVLGSVGEEAGFKDGWGKRYYWETAVAPEKACKAFQWFLKEKYPDIARLNDVWHTKFTGWDQVKLAKEFSNRAPRLETDGWAHPKDVPLGEGVTGVSLAPYLDTEQFYNWYYDKIIDVARRILREQINPVTLTMSSAPTIGSANYDVRLTGPSAWNESQLYSTIDGPEPGYGLIWGHFDWSVMTDNMFWGFLLTRSGHNNYWVDVPLMFNNDMTLTRSTFAMRRWTNRLAGHERIILDSLPTTSQVGVLGPNGLGASRTPGNMETSLQVALNQGGFGLPGSNEAKLSSYKIVFAIGRQAMNQEEADKLNTYVEDGGTLVFTPRFASQTALGAPQEVAPGCGLGKKWGLTVMEKPASQSEGNETDTFTLDGVDPAFKGMKMSSYRAFREKVMADGWQQLAAYPDGRPALLIRQYGKGRLVYLNAVYQSHWYIQWVTPTGPERQGFYKLVEWLCAQAGARRTLRIDGDLNQTLHMAVKQFTDPSGSIGYAIVRTNGEVPWTTGKLTWLGTQTACYDVLGSGPGKPAALRGKAVTLNLKPGAGKLLAFVQEPVKTVRVTAKPDMITAGEPLQLSVAILGASGKPVPGAFPLEIQVNGPGGEIAGLHRSLSLASGGSITLNTALNDPTGDWTVKAIDGISGLFGSTSIKIVTAKTAAGAPGFVAWGQPSEIQEPTKLSEAQFLDRLRRLSALYRKDHTADGWMTKQYLGYFYDYFPETRHDLLRDLDDVDWTSFVPAITRAVNGGETFVLSGEDLGIHPGSGLAVYPHFEGKQMQALAVALTDAKWSLASSDGETIMAELGKGRVVLCRESIDAAGNTSPELVRWQGRWLRGLYANTQPIPAPALEKLLRWWIGQESITPAQRVIEWFGGNQREAHLLVDASKPIGDTFTIVLPPTGAVKQIDFAVNAKGNGKILFDIGCDDQPDGVIDECPAQPVAISEVCKLPWADAINKYLAWASANGAAYRDDSGWRIVPVRVLGDGKVDLVLSNLKVTVQ